MTLYIDKIMVNGATYTIQDNAATQKLMEVPTTSTMSTYVLSKLSNYITENEMQTYVSSSLLGYVPSAPGGGIISNAQVIDQASYDKLVSSGTFNPLTIYIITL